MRLSVRPATKFIRSLGFSRAVASAPDSTNYSAALPAAYTLSPGKLLPGSTALSKRKDISSRGLRRRLRVRLRYRLVIGTPLRAHRPNPCAGSGILTGFPFEPREPFQDRRNGPLHFHPLAVRLRTDSPMSNCCSHGTFLHFSLQSSHLNICYCHQDPHYGPFHPGLRLRLRNAALTQLSHTPSYSLHCDSSATVEYRSHASAPSIFRANSFGR